MIIIKLLGRKLSDASVAWELQLSDGTDGVVALPAVTRDDAMFMAYKIEDAIAAHTNERVEKHGRPS